MDAETFAQRERGAFWDWLAGSGVTLLVTREYEHLLVALSGQGERPQTSYLQVPHPSGLAVDRSSATVHVASTRNPNQIFTLRPARVADSRSSVLLPARTRFLPGRLYLHDLALIGDRLYANAVGLNAIVRLDDPVAPTPVWWPTCIDTPSGPAFDRNYIQLNSIAAGPDLSRSYFSASSARIARTRPGHRNYPVDGQGVIFSAETRGVIAEGLTRPHSARLHMDTIWVANSGYGEVGIIRDRRFEPVLKLPGWTRGLCFVGETALVGTSRVIPRFRHYAPGLDHRLSVCGVHALDLRTGRLLGSLVWPTGNQIFALDWIPGSVVSSLPYRPGRSGQAREKALFFSFEEVA